MRKTVRLLVLAAIAAPALAQDISPAVDLGTMSQGLVISSTMNAQAERDAARLHVQGHPVAHDPTNVFASAFRREAPSEGSVAPIRLSYAPTRALQKQVEAAFVSRLHTKSPDAAQQLAAEMAKHDFGKIYTSLVGSYGLRGNDAADAVTAYTLLGWLIVHSTDRNTDVPPAVAQAMRDRIAPALAANPALSRQRAVLGEEMKIMTVTLHAGWQSAERHNTLPAFVDGVVRVFRQQTGVDLRGVKLNG